MLTLCTNAEIINIPDDQPTIQAGIDVASDSDTVLVQPGLYIENINFTGKNITVASLFILTSDTSFISQTIIDGNQNGSVVVFENQEDESAKLTGFTIQNGLSGNNFNTTYGGGICCIQSGPTLEYLIVKENSTEQRGGGISCTDCSPIINNIQILDNYAESWGGGINCKNSNPIISECILSNNSVTANGGGGIYCSDNSNPLIENCYISNNSANNGGGGISCWINSSPEIINVTIYNNESDFGGGGIFTAHDSHPVIISSMISCNKTTGRGGGIRPGSTVYLESVTIKDNYAEEGGGIFIYNSSSVVFSEENRCNIYSNYAIFGNDLYASSSCTVVVDTFTVMEPTQYHAWLETYFTFDILHGYHEQTTSDLYVSPSGDDNNTGLSWSSPLKTIRRAFSKIISTSINEGTIHLGPGIYCPSTENEYFPLPAMICCLTLEGSGPGTTIIDAEYASGAIYMKYGYEVTIKNLSVTRGEEYGLKEEFSNFTTLESIEVYENNGYGIWSYMGNELKLNYISAHNNGDGSGIYLYGTDNIVLNNSVVYENFTTSQGGGICLNNGASADLTNIAVFNNIGGAGGGIFSDHYSKLLLKNVSIRNNHAHLGGGINILGDSVTFSHDQKCSIYSNHAGKGNDIILGMYDTTMLIVDTFSVFNPTSFHIYGLENITGLSILNCIYNQVNSNLYVSLEGDDQNTGTSQDNPLKTIGTALSKLLPDTVNQRTIYINEGVYNINTNGEFFPLSIAVDNISLSGDSYNTTVLKGQNLFSIFNIYDANNIYINNMTLQDGYHESIGGGMYSSNSNLTLNNLKIQYNTAKYKGSAIYSSGGNISIDKTYIIENNIKDGGGTVAVVYSDIKIMNSTIANNSSDYAGAIYQPGSNSVIVNSILWNNSSYEIYMDNWSQNDTVTLAFTDIRGGDSAIVIYNYGFINYLEGNINQEPMLKPDYTLQPGSPCIDAGTDFFNWQGDTLVYFPVGSYFGEAPDMGAYESGLGIGIPAYPSSFISARDDFSVLYSYNLNPEIIQIKLKELTFFNFSLYDLSGRNISESIKIRYNAGIQNLKINFLFPYINTYPSGIYILKMQTTNSSISKKLLLY